MVSSTGLFSLLLLGIISTVTGQLTVQSDWVFPQSPDYSTSVSLGSTVYFKWTSNLQNQFEAYLPNGNVSHVDVWVTGETISDGYHKLAANFDVSSTQSFQWTVVVPAEELEKETTWVFRFVALDDDPAHLQYQVSSPVFQIVDNTKSKMASSSSSSSASSSSSTSSTSSTTSTSATSSASSATSTTPTSTNSTSTATTSTSRTSTTTSLPSTTAPPTPSTTGTSSNSTAPPPLNSPSTALTTGAKIGVAIGATAAAICTCSLIMFLCFRRRKYRHYASHGRVRMSGDPVMEIQQDVSYVSKGKA